MLIISYYTGIQLHDTCGSVITTQKHLFQVISATREDVPLRLRSINLGPPLLGKKKQVFSSTGRKSLCSDKSYV